MNRQSVFCAPRSLSSARFTQKRRRPALWLCPLCAPALASRAAPVRCTGDSKARSCGRGERRRCPVLRRSAKKKKGSGRKPGRPCLLLAVDVQSVPVRKDTHTQEEDAGARGQENPARGQAGGLRALSRSAQRGATGGCLTTEDRAVLCSPAHCPTWTVPRVLVRRTASPAHADFGGLHSLADLIVVRLVVVPLPPCSLCRQWRVVCWADILLDVISGVESAMREGCPRTMTGFSQYWFSGHFRQVFSTPMHYPALTLVLTCGENRAS